MTNIIQLPAPRRGYQAPVPVADFCDLEKRLRDDAPVHLMIDNVPLRLKVKNDARLLRPWRLFWADVAEAPVHHSVFALVVFIASCVLIYGSAWVLVEFAL